MPRQNELPRGISSIDQKCYKCGETIEAKTIYAIYLNNYYCECCVEDYEEEGRPLDQ